MKDLSARSGGLFSFRNQQDSPGISTEHQQPGQPGKLLNRAFSVKTPLLVNCCQTKSSKRVNRSTWPPRSGQQTANRTPITQGVGRCGAKPCAPKFSSELRGGLSSPDLLRPPDDRPRSQHKHVHSLTDRRPQVTRSVDSKL